MQALGQVAQGTADGCGCDYWGPAVRPVWKSRGNLWARGWGGGLRGLRGCSATVVRLLWGAVCPQALH